MSNNTDELVLSVRGLCVVVAREVASWYKIKWHFFGDDLVSAAYVGACIAAQKFDLKKGSKFISYARFYIRRFAINEAYNILVLRGYRTQSYSKSTRDCLSFSSTDQPALINDGIGQENTFLSLILDHNSEHSIPDQAQQHNDLLEAMFSSLSLEERYIIYAYFFDGKHLTQIAKSIHNPKTDRLGVHRLVADKKMKDALAKLSICPLLKEYR